MVSGLRIGGETDTQPPPHRHHLSERKCGSSALTPPLNWLYLPAPSSSDHTGSEGKAAVRMEADQQRDAVEWRQKRSPKTMNTQIGIAVSEPKLVTAQEAVALIEAETKSVMKAQTFRSYVYRDLAPAPVKKVGRTLLFSRKQIIEWAQNRPGSGARTDISDPKRTRRTTSAATPSTRARAKSADTEPLAKDDA